MFPTYSEQVITSDNIQYVIKLAYARAYIDGYRKGYRKGSTLKLNKEIATADTLDMIEVINNMVQEIKDDVKYIRDKLDKIDDKFNEKLGLIDVRLGQIETDMTYIKSATQEIKTDIKDLPIINHTINELKKSNDWWKQYLVAPIITGVVVGILLLVSKKVFGV